MYKNTVLRFLIRGWLPNRCTYVEKRKTWRIKWVREGKIRKPVLRIRHNAVFKTVCDKQTKQTVSIFVTFHPLLIFFLALKTSSLYYLKTVFESTRLVLVFERRFDYYFLSPMTIAYAYWKFYLNSLLQKEEKPNVCTLCNSAKTIYGISLLVLNAF